MKDKTPEWTPVPDAEMRRRETNQKLFELAWRMRGNAERLAFSALPEKRRELVGKILEDVTEYRRIAGEEDKA